MGNSKPAEKPKSQNSTEKRLSLGRSRPNEEAIFPVAPQKMESPNGYGNTLSELKSLIQDTRLRSVVSANSTMIILYWEIGRIILARQIHEGWGAKTIDRLSSDLRRAFPEMSGFSARNLKYMRAFAAAWQDEAIVQRTLHKLPWGVNVKLLDALSEPSDREWYAEHAIQYGWSRDILAMQIERRLHERDGKAVTNFTKTLPSVDSDLASQYFKDPYLFDFLGTADPRREAELENVLVDNVQKFLLELGVGFAFVGRQVPLEVGDSDFKVDLLFYHFKLHAFVVVEIKSGPFKPEYAGKMSFYLSVADDLLKSDDDNPSIGLILCKSKNRVQAEYALRGVNKPIGVADWETKLVEKLPKHYLGNLPTIEEIEAELKDSTFSEE